MIGMGEEMIEKEKDMKEEIQDMTDDLQETVGITEITDPFCNQEKKDPEDLIKKNKFLKENNCIYQKIMNLKKTLEIKLE